MTRTTDLMHASADTWRRRAILEGCVGIALLSVAVLCALRSETWHATLVALAAGATLSAAVLTYAKARLWERVAVTRGKAESWPSPLASKGEV